MGRSRSCQVVLRDPSVSRSHALITVQGEALTLKDLASSNGTFVNSEKAEGEMELQVGDQLTFGETRLDLALLDREDAFSFAGLIEEVELETGEMQDFDPILETIQQGEGVPRGGAEGGFGDAEGEPALEIDGTPVAGVPQSFVEPIVEPMEEEPLPELPLDEAMEELDHLLSEKPEPLPPTPLPPPSRTTSLDIAPALDPGEMKAVVARLLPEDEKEEVAPSAPSRPLAETAGELLPSLDDLDDLGALGTGPQSSPVAARGAAAAPGGPGAARSVAQPDRMPSPRAAPSSLPPAGFGIRLVASALDGMLVLVVAGAISLLAGGPWLAEGGAVFFSVILGLSFVLHVFGWNLWGTTPAKRLFGLYVCPVGGPPGIVVGSAVLRFAGYAVSVLSLGLGFLMVAFSPGRRGLHDVLAGTYVGRWQR